MAIVFTGCKEESLDKGKSLDKEKVSYIEPAFSTWAKLLQVYIMENNAIGDCETIGYTPPGAENPSNFSKTRGFLFVCGAEKKENNNIAYLQASSENIISGCPTVTKFTIEFDTEKGSFNVSTSPEKTCSLFENIVNNLNKTFSNLKYEGVKFEAKPIWKYKEFEDKMDNSKTYLASVTSTNEINFSSPYDGGSSFYLNVRNDNKQNEVYLKVSKGQFGGSSKTCRVKFDDNPVVSYDYMGTSDYSSDVIFFKNPKKFIASLKKAKKLMIECAFFQEGARIIEFDDVQGLEWDR